MRRLLSPASLVAALLVGPALLLASPDPDVGGPTEEVQDLWAASTLDDEALAAATDTLTAWFERDGQHLLDQPLDYSFIESVSLEDLRAVDVVDLSEAGWDPLEAMATDRPGLDARLARARGVLSTSALRCSIDAVEARLRPSADLALVESTGVDVFAEQPLRRSIVSGSRTATLDIDGALTRVILEIEVQPSPADLDETEATIAQRWQLDLWIERDRATTLRLRSTWIEASSPSFHPDNRAWMGWVLHDAFEDAEVWNEHCAQQPAGPPVATSTPPEASERGRSTSPTRSKPTPPPVATQPPTTGTATRPGAATQAPVPLTDAPANPATKETGPPAAPLCEGLALIEVEPWALHLVEIKHSSSSRLGSSGPEDITVDQAAIDRWIEQGIRSWRPALGLDRHAEIPPAEHARLRRLVERFGPKPRLLREEQRARFAARWRMGLLREFLDQEPVLIPVCPAAIEFTATKLGYTSVKERQRKRDDIEEITALVLLEQGSVATVGEEEWATMAQILAFGDAILRMMGRPDSEIDGKPDIDAVDSKL